MSINIDVMEVLEATGSVLRSNVRRQNNRAARGNNHPETLVKQDRAIYLLDQHEKACKAVAALIEASEAMQGRIAYYASLGEDADENIEDWAYTDKSGDMIRLRSALARVKG